MIKNLMTRHCVHLRPRVQRALYLVMTCLCVSLLAGCGITEVKSERANSEWSRGIRLGTASINDRVAMTVATGGEDVYVAWVQRRDEEGPESLRLARLDGAGHLLANMDLPIGVESPHGLRLVGDDLQHLHLIWVAREGSLTRLFHSRLGLGGEVLSYPRPVSSSDQAVSSFGIVRDGQGLIHIVYAVENGSSEGLCYLRLDSWGDLAVAPAMLDVSGFNPALCLGSDGILHLAWQDEPDYGRASVYYAVLNLAALSLQQKTTLASFPEPIGVLARRPDIGVTKGDVYVFWSRERRGGGLTPPSADAFYSVFPLGQPEVAGEPLDISFSASNYPPLERRATGLSISELAPPMLGSDTTPTGSFTYLPSVAQGGDGPLAVVLSHQLRGRTKSIIQVVMTYWSEGEPTGYQIVAKTRNSSLKPVAHIDAHGDLHLAWIDTAGFGAFDVYYASTARAVRANLNRVAPADVAAVLFDLGWALVQGISFLPMTLTWLFVPLAAIAIYLFISAEGRLDRRGPRIMLVVAIVLYIGFKYLFRPTWLAALPLPRRTPIYIMNVLSYVAPLCVSGLAGVVTWLYLRRRDYGTLLAAFAVFAGTDALLTLLVYVPGVLRE